MDNTILKLLRRDAMTWWYHKTLRDQGRADEAIPLERKCIRRALETLRFAKRAGILRWHDRGRSVEYGDDPEAEHGTFDTGGKWRSQTVASSGVHIGEWAALHLVMGRKLDKRIVKELGL